MSEGKEKRVEKTLKVSVWDGITVEDMLSGIGTKKKFSKTHFKMLLLVIGLMIVSSFIGSFLNGILGFVLSLIFGVIGCILGFRARETMTETVRVEKIN